MRLVCPNCAAQYEVDDGNIPEGGRNVQCANCEKTWFQEPAGADKSAGAKKLSPGRQALRKAKADTAPTEEPSPEQILEAEAAQEAGQSDGGSDDTATTSEAPAIDQSVLDILRKEAELDAEVRNSERHAPTRDAPGEFAQQEHPVEPDADNLANRARAARSRMNVKRERERRLHISADQAESYGDDFVNPTAENNEDPGGRRQLPDIDELNSSLRSANDKSRPAEHKGQPVTPRRKVAGRVGFYLAVWIALLLTATYTLDEQIVSSVPQAEPFLDSYTTQVDKGRLWLDGVANDVVAAAKNLLAQYL